MGMVLVTHDLGVAAEIAGRVAVMYAGQIVEEGPVRDVLRHPAHPYMRGLLASVVRADGAETPGIPGTRPTCASRRPAAPSPRCPAAVGRAWQGFQRSRWWGWGGWRGVFGWRTCWRRRG